MSWDSLVTGFSTDLKLWLKFEDSTTGGTGTDSSGNGNSVVYPNGTYAPGGYLYPKRGQPALVDGTTDSILTGGGGNAEIHVAAPFGANFLTGGSWTFGGAVKSTATAGSNAQWGYDGGVKATAGFNYNYSTSSTESGTLSLIFDWGGSGPDALVATGTGWNDGNPHLLFFEYDATADTLSIRLDGTEIATRARAGTKPTSGNLSGMVWKVAGSLGIAGLGMDEFICVQRVLTDTEHDDLVAAAFSTPVTATMAGTWGGWTGAMSATVTSGPVAAVMDGSWGGWSGAMAATVTSGPVSAVLAGAWGGWTGAMSVTVSSASGTTVTATMDGSWGGWSASAFAFPTGPLTINGGTVYSYDLVGGGMLTLASTPAPDDTGFVTVSSAGTVVTTLSGPTAADFEPMWNDAGSGSVTYEIADESITYGDVVRCYYKGRAAFSWIATERNANSVPAGGAESPTVTWTGPGWITETSSARVRPSRGFGASPVEETRSFGWASTSYDDSTWVYDSVSLGVMGNPTPYWYGLANYPDAETEWMWAPGASTSWSRTGDVYFRQWVNDIPEGNYEIAFVADDRGELYLDGQRLLTTGNWDNTTSSIHTQNVFLSAGDHLIAVWAQNNVGEYGNNPAGVLVTVTGEGGTGAVLRSGAGWRCLPYPIAPPGVTIADAFLTILNEAQSDGVLPNLDVWFDSVTDTAGTPWAYLNDVTAPVGSDLWTFIKAHAGVDFNIRMRPGEEVLDAWVPNGGGSSRAVTLHTPTDVNDPYSGNLMSLEHQSQAARANAAVVRWAKGWKYVSTGETPVVEIQLDLGHITDEDEAERVALDELNKLSTVREQITATVDVRDGEWPWWDYQEGDLITVPDSSGAATEQRVVALAATLEDDEVTITPTLKDRIAEDIERHENWLKAMAEGASRGNSGAVSPPVLAPYSYPPPSIKWQTWSLPTWTAKDGGVFPAPTLWVTRRVSFNLDSPATGTRTAAVKVNGSTVATLTLTTGEQSTYAGLTTVVEAGDQVSIVTTGTESFGGNVTLEYSAR